MDAAVAVAVAVNFVVADMTTIKTVADQVAVATDVTN